MNCLFFGDNLSWLENTKELPDASIDLVCLDPPFNSKADYTIGGLLIPYYRANQALPMHPAPSPPAAIDEKCSPITFRLILAR